MKKIQESKGSSFYIGMFPEGCKLCMEGKKIVIFITGLCGNPQACKDYCPLSEERRNKDVTFANDRPVNSFDDILLEARNMKAEGAGITGGDPLMKLDRTLEYINKLKEIFGRKFQIHLYCSTSPNLTEENLKKLKEAGLDEIRFHLEPNLWSLMLVAKKIGLKVGAEVPALDLDQLKKIGRFLDENNLDFLNINELEFSETNAKTLKSKGFQFDEGSIAAAKGSDEIAKSFLKWALKYLTINIHYCPISLKDGSQFKNRMIRTAKNLVKPHEIVTDDGLILKGIIKWKKIQDKKLILNLIEENFEIPKEFIFINEDLKRIEIYWEVLDETYELFKENKLECGIVQELPDYNHTIIRYDPF